MAQKNFYIYKRGKRGAKGKAEEKSLCYYVRFRDPKTRKLGNPISTCIKNHTVAEQWAQNEYDKSIKSSGSSKILYGEWIGRFYKTGCPHVSSLYDNKRSIGETTMKQNRRYIDDYILKDEVCNLTLEEIRRTDIMDFKDRLIANKERSRTTQQIFQVFSTSLKEAVTHGLLEVSPASGVPKIAYEVQIRKAVNFKDILKILDVVYWDDLNAWRGAMTAAFTGMRAGEVCGLLWPGVDNPKGKITLYNNRPAHLSKDKKPKWDKIRITIYPQQIREILEPLRQPNGYVFAVDDGPISYDTIANALDRACKKAEVRATMHQLRHSLNTYLRGEGVPDDILRGVFGWSAKLVNGEMISATQEGYTHRELYDLTPLETALSKLL